MQRYIVGSFVFLHFSVEFICFSVCVDSGLLPDSGSKKCDGAHPSMRVPHSSLIEMPKSINNYISLPEYTIKPGIDHLTFSCSFKEPILWKIYPRSSFLHSKVDFYAKLQNQSSRDVEPYICYTTTITLSNLNENASGSYDCGWRDRNRYTFYNHLLGFYLYIGNDQSSGRTLISPVVNVTVEHPEITFSGGTQEDALIVPCSYNYPKNLTVVVILRNDNGNVFPGFESPIPAHRCHNMHCIFFFSFNRNESIQLLHKNGGTILCEIQESSTVRATTLINILPSPQMVFEPLESDMTLKVKIGESYTFSCRSTKPAEITTNYAFDKIITIIFKENQYYKHKGELTITIPEAYRTVTPDGDIPMGNLRNIHLKVTCKSEDQVQVWKYLLDTQEFEEPCNDANYTQKCHARSIMPISIRNGVLICESAAPSTIKPFFVPCSTFNDCEMKSQLLYMDQDYLHRLSLSAIRARSAFFYLPESVASSHASGMGRCVGFQQDEMSILFAYSSHQNEAKFYAALNNKEVQLDRRGYSQVSVDKQEIFQDEFVIANCSTPLMLIISHSYWEFDYRNTLHSLISPDYIVESYERSSGGTFSISAKIQIPYLNITGISCTNDQLVRVSPFVWKNGTFIRNAEKITYDRKRASILIRVNQRSKEEIPASHTSMIIGSIFGILFVITSIIAGVTFYYLRASRNENERIRQEDIDNFKQGNPQLLAPGNSDNPQHTAYDDSVEMNLDELNIDFKCVLGSGEFGIVYKGTAYSKTQPLVVTVKTIKPGAGGNYLRAMMAELKVMLYIKIHSNVVSVIGACTSNLLEHKLFIILEFCLNGDLYTYIRKNSKGFLNFVTRGTISNNAVALSESEYTIRMTTLNLIKWSSQIADGMAYISKLNVIHGDLAARNVLLDENLVAKISDFGLSKKLYQYSLYVRRRAVPIPWRWLAVESLTFTEFSTASDVWSYGVTLWEIFSLGSLPYPGQEYNRCFIQMLRDGFRLPLPEYAPYEIYNMILECWKNVPTERPKFEELKSQLDAMLGDYIVL